MNNKKLFHKVITYYAQQYENVGLKSEKEMDLLAQDFMKVCFQNEWICKNYMDYSDKWRQIKKDIKSISNCSIKECIILLTFCQRENYWSYDYKTYIKRTKDGTIPALINRIYKLLLEEE